VRSTTHIIIAASLAVTMLGAVGRAQETKPAPSPFGEIPGPITPIKVQIVIARYQGDRKVSSLPFTLSVNANDGRVDPAGRYNPTAGFTKLRIGAQVAVPQVAVPKESPVQGPAGPMTYRDVGTNIDCMAYSTGDGRFRVFISINDTSVYSEGQTPQGVLKLPDIPAFRSFQSSNTVILKDGQSTQFTAATDKITGEVTKVDVTLNVEK
jgi:hypothetical protein